MGFSFNVIRMPGATFRVRRGRQAEARSGGRSHL